MSTTFGRISDVDFSHRAFYRKLFRIFMSFCYVNLVLVGRCCFLVVFLEKDIRMKFILKTTLFIWNESFFWVREGGWVGGW